MVVNQLVQTHIDGAIKVEAASVLAAMGLTVSGAVRLMPTKVAHEKALPFEPLVPNVATIAAIKVARADKATKAERLDALFRDINANNGSIY
ncbi:MAG: type II toxin-antitoxin system RelB/DinJ family antitoxin [Proteobacteria bacterium]|nr:type II toxin-antitoxin system RelB/DinJ family antitoxin [Pseudomonadota bacterium]MCL2307067.1 type II toxin-antitoxin system RelB/DinJ family antitoxin [Pseudomonadota bacterium]